MVAAFDFCLHGRGGAAPSIDTAMHGLVDAAHVDHLHPDCGIALATAADGEQLTKRLLRRPGRLGAVAPPRLPARPRHRRGQGGEPAGDRRHPRWARHHRVGRDQRRGRGQLAGDHRPRRGLHRGERRRRAVRRDRARQRAAARGTSAAPRRPRSPRPSARSGLDRPAQVGHFTDTDVVLDFLARREARAAGRARHLVPRPLPAHQGQAAGARPARRRVDRRRRRPAGASCTSSTARTTPPTTSGTPPRTRPPMRGADPAIVLVPGVGMFSYGKDKQTARVAGEFYVNAINVMRGAEAISTYAPIDESEKFRIEYWALEEAKLAADAQAQAAGRPASRWSPARRRASARRSRSGSPPRAPASWSPTSTPRRRAPSRRRSAPPTSRSAWRADVTDEDAVRRRRRRDRARVRRHRPRRQQRRTVDLQVAARDHRGRLGPAARRDGQGLASWSSRAAAKAMIDQGSAATSSTSPARTRVFAGPEQHRLRRDQGRPGPPGAAAGRRTRRARHPGQRHQPRRRRARLRHLRRRLGRQARRGLRRAGGGARRVLRAAHAAQARGAARARRQRRVRRSPAETCRHTTGLHVPVDAGVAAAFLR